MFEGEKDKPDGAEDVPTPEADEPQSRQAVPVDPAECSPPEDDGAQALPPNLAKVFQAALERAMDETKADAVQEVEGKYRDQFAVVAMGSIVRGDMMRGQGFEPLDIAERAYDVAEAMLTERAVRESFGHRRSAEVVTAITKGRAAMKASFNEAEKAVGLAESMNHGAEKARRHTREFLSVDHIREARMQRVRELVDAETSPGLSPAIVATDCGCSQLEAQELIEAVRAERKG